MIFVLPVKLSIKVEKMNISVVDQVNEILSKYADKNAELVSFLPSGGTKAKVSVVIQYDA
ncbi:hypothetical protein LCGC14_1666230 [marine sediment metagenome]|uniref:Uncharacterized protein n=1 Tax=marine sediment metagenome TaxID=412755 RepID=A0A0F9K8F9_9ZZZZ|nr:hypothetical protein [bacterium]